MNKEMQKLNEAKALVENFKYDQALDMLTSGQCGQRASEAFSDNYISKNMLKNFSHIKLSAHPELGDFSIDNLGDSKWFKYGYYKGETNTIFLANVGNEIMYNINNCLSLVNA